MSQKILLFWLVDLVKRMQNEHGLIRGRLTPECLLALWLQGRAYVEFAEDGPIIAFCALFPTADARILEIGAFYVDPRYRTKSNFAKMLRFCFEHWTPRGVSLICHTTTRFAKILKSYDVRWGQINEWQSNARWTEICKVINPITLLATEDQGRPPGLNLYFLDKSNELTWWDDQKNQKAIERAVAG